MARISTHVLDTTRGLPARGVEIDLHQLVGDERRPVATAVTNVDGRTDAPLLTSDYLTAGIYELTFRTADYFRLADVALTSPPFLGDIVIRFGVADPMGNYHIPLLLAPYGYSTDRGS